MIDANVGAPIDNLLMRVEEMYFIEAEAIAASQGGKRWNFCFGEFYENLSLQFLPMYGTAMEDFRKELILQKKNRVLGRGYYLLGL